MSGDWIKMEHVTPDKPEIVQLAEILKIDQDAVFGKCFRIWAWADQQTISGNDLRVTYSFLDRLSNCPGFSSALAEVGWLTSRNGKISIPNFDRHNGQTAKNRALTKARVEKLRNEQIVTESLPEKRREEKKEEKKTPEISGVDKSPKVKPKKEFEPESIPYKAAVFMWSYVREWSPTALEPTEARYQAWARDLDLMFRLDGRSTGAFNELLDWIDRSPPSRSGFTWRKNILSPETLRQRWKEGKFADFLPSELKKEEYR